MTRTHSSSLEESNALERARDELCENLRERARVLAAVKGDPAKTLG